MELNKPIVRIQHIEMVVFSYGYEFQLESFTVCEMKIVFVTFKHGICNSNISNFCLINQFLLFANSGGQYSKCAIKELCIFSFQNIMAIPKCKYYYEIDITVAQRLFYCVYLAKISMCKYESNKHRYRRSLLSL